VTAGLPERWPLIGLTEEWYSGPPVRLGGEYVQFRARTPWVALMLRRDAIGEHARWAYDMTLKYGRPQRPWRFWSIKDLASPVDVRVFRLGPVDRALGWALTVLCLLAALRRG
jgi:hypothetical protein